MVTIRCASRSRRILGITLSEQNLWNSALPKPFKKDSGTIFVGESYLIQNCDEEGGREEEEGRRNIETNEKILGKPYVEHRQHMDLVQYLSSRPYQCLISKASHSSRSSHSSD